MADNRTRKAESSGLTIILTGANCGLGLECAKKLCELGHDVVITVRDKEKGENTLSVVKSFVPNARICFFILDISDFTSVRSFVKDIHATRKRLDILINNAGVMPSYKGTERLSVNDNPKMELAMTVNCLGTFLLTNLLLDDLKSSVAARGDGSPSRIVNVSSGLTVMAAPPGVHQCSLNLDDFMLERPGNYHSGHQAYRNSKVALNLWTNEMAKRVSDSKVLVNSVTPGYIIETNLARNTQNFMSQAELSALRKSVQTTSLDDGRDRILDIALNNSELTGKFFSGGKVTEECPEVNNVDMQARIWDICEAYTGLI